MSVASSIQTRAKLSGISCLACRSSHVIQTNFKVDAQYPLYKCQNCGFGFLDLQGENDTDGSFDDYWDDVNQRIYVDPKVISELGEKYSQYYGQIARSAPNPRLLDVGSGVGISIDTARTFGFDPLGVEPSPKAVALSRKMYSINVVCDLLRADDNLDRDFGVLTLWDVIEHVEDPEQLLAICAGHLADRGVLLLETPDEGSSLRRLIRTASRVGISMIDGRRSIYYRDHRYYFTRQAMRELLARCGFGRVEFFSERTMYQKEFLKKRMYLALSRSKETALRMLFWFLRTLPLLDNKMVVVATKLPTTDN